MAKPLQKRALATREKILDGLETLLERKEFEMISIAELAREAAFVGGHVEVPLARGFEQDCRREQP